MKRILFFLITAVITLAACDDTTDTLGSSLVGTDNQVFTKGDAFGVASWSKRLTKVNSRSAYGYLGKIKDPETNAYVTCNFMTQLRPMGNSQFIDYDKIALNSNGELEADSCTLLIYFPTHYGDSLSRITAVAHELKTPYREDQIYYIDAADFTPKDMIADHEGSIHTALSFTPANQLHSGTQKAGGNYTPYISFSLNDKYKDKQGVEYHDYGTYLMKKFFDEKSKGYFSGIYEFNNNICPGFYIETVNGLGSMLKISVTQLYVYYHNKNNEVEIASFGGTQEVMQKTTIQRDETELQKMIDDQTCTYLKSPASIYTEMELPVQKVWEGHSGDSLNVAKLTIPCLATPNSTIGKPTTLLMLPADELQSFFDNKKTADGVMSFTATYNSTDNNYTFNNIATLVTRLYQKWAKSRQALVDAGDAAALAAFDAKPHFNVAVVPIEATYSTITSGSSVLMKVTYDLSMTTAKLAKGTKENSPLQLNVIYSHYGKQ